MRRQQGNIIMVACLYFLVLFVSIAVTACRSGGGGSGDGNSNPGSGGTNISYSGTFVASGSANDHTATLLSSGKVLIAGQAGKPAYLYDPVADTSQATGNTVIAPIPDVVSFPCPPCVPNNASFGMSVQLSNGKVLLMGSTYGWGSGRSSYRGTNLYDPTTGIFTLTGIMNHGREDATATLLPNGGVLIVGGDDIGWVYLACCPSGWTMTSGNVFADGEIYDPTNGTFTLTGAMNAARTYHTATLLPNGKVLIAGGSSGNITSGSPIFGTVGSETFAFSTKTLASVELYDPTTGAFAPIGSLNTARSCHTATLLPNGKILFVGGYDGTSYLSSAEIYDPTTGASQFTGSLNTTRTCHTATLLPNNKVLITGGYDGKTASLSSTTAELYDPTSGVFTKTTGNMLGEHYAHHATLLLSGKVLITGNGPGPELFQ